MIKDGTVIVSRVFDASVDLVWKALTDNELLKQWYFVLPEFRAEVGFTFEFIGGEEGGKQYQHKCEITEVVFEKKLSYSWKYVGYTGNSLVTFNLKSENGKTLVTITHEGLDTFPSDVKDLNITNFDTGWTGILNQSLANFLSR